MFKVGDRVKVIGNPNDMSNYNSTMNYDIGVETTIQEVDSNGWYLLVDVSWHWHTSMLRRVNNKTKKYK